MVEMTPAEINILYVHSEWTKFHSHAFQCCLVSLSARWQLGHWSVTLSHQGTWPNLGHSWLIPHQRCIGRHDSSSSSCPLQPHPSWCPFSWDLSWQHLSSSVGGSTWPPPETLGFPYESLSWSVSPTCQLNKNQKFKPESQIWNRNELEPKTKTSG